MTLNTAVKRAIESGYKVPFHFMENGRETVVDISSALLDPLFWQCLGVAMGWECKRHKACKTDLKWKAHWHSFIDALASGKTAEEFFQELLK